MKKWWTCPKCKAHKFVEEKTNCIRCPECGRYFNEKHDEIDVNISIYDLNPVDKSCDLS